MIFTITILIAGLLYLASFGLSSSAKFQISARICAIVGFATHSFGLLAIMLETNAIPVGTPYELLESIAWAFVFIRLMTSKGFKQNYSGLLPAAILTLLPIACPIFTDGVLNAKRSGSTFASTHGMLAAISYGFMIASAIAALMYFRQKKFLRDKFHNATSKSLPPLDTLERSMSGMIGVATLLMFASAIMGVVAATRSEISSAMSLKFCVGALILILQISIYICSLMKILSGARLAKAVIILAIVALVALIPIEIGT